MIGDMVNHATMIFHFSDHNSSILFPTRTHMAFFNIILVDLLSKPNEFFKDDKNYIGLLIDICANPFMDKNDNIQELKSSVIAFDSWLSEKVTVENRWFPSIDLQVNLSLQRQTFIRICGNIAKHNFTRLTVAAEMLRKVLEANGQSVSLDKCIVALEDFREQFFDDVLNYHASTIAEFLNNIRWGIYIYASTVRERCVVNNYNQQIRLNIYTYSYPKDVDSDLGKACFWNLMDDVREPPYIQRFEVDKYLKIRY